MLLNPYAAAAKLVGIKAPSQAMQALPHFTGGRKNVGATRSTRAVAMPVIGSPSMRVVREQDGGVKTLLRRNMAHADLLSNEDFRRLDALLSQIETTAKGLSQGGLSLKALAARNHPYGRGLMASGQRRGGLGRLSGARGGVSNLAVVNRQSGAFAGDWASTLLRDKSGVTFVLENKNKHAAQLAFGTKRMKAHGPFSTAVAKHLSAVDSEWRRLAKVATARDNALSQISAAQGLNRGANAN